uniref:Uncharacterized protein n=1 Tax=Anguilla anguilla TaxID=7936 RepID=A0A0E9VEV9_ANGAN
MIRSLTVLAKCYSVGFVAEGTFSAFGFGCPLQSRWPPGHRLWN